MVFIIGVWSLVSEAQVILHEGGGTKAIRTDWRQQVVRPVVAEAKANNAGVSTPDVPSLSGPGSRAKGSASTREGDELLPIAYRAPERERAD